MAKTPLGLYWRTDYVRCLKSVFTSETKKYLLSEMKRNPNNIKTVVVLDNDTKKAQCFFPNDKLSDFDSKYFFKLKKIFLSNLKSNLINLSLISFPFL